MRSAKVEMKPTRGQFTLGSLMIAIAIMALVFANPGLAVNALIIAVTAGISTGLLIFIIWRFLPPSLPLFRWIRSRKGSVATRSQEED